MTEMGEPFTFDLTSTDPAADDDRLYEDIEAPKFVDLTADRYVAVDGSWFCERIGCDQNHEEVDPEKLHRNFILKVLAARSPNVRFQKALKGRSAIPKCPRTAPVKSAKSEARESISDKAAISKFKAHPISALKSTPAKATADPCSSVSKCLTTPGIKKSVSFADPFRSTKVPKSSAPMAKNRAVARSLTFLSPPKVHKSQTSVAEMCSGIEKLRIGSPTKHISRHLCKSLIGGAADSKTPKKSAVAMPSRLHVSAAKLKNKDQKEWKKGEQKDQCPSSQKTCNDQNGIIVDEKLRSGIEGKTCNDGAYETTHKQNWKGEEFPEKNRVPEEKVSISASNQKSDRTDSSMVFDDDKENTSTTPILRNILRNTNAEKENISHEPSNNSTTKPVVSAPSKISQSDIQGTHRKLKHTNPKPFRLRTDERGILREAKIEKRAHLNVLGEIKPASVKPERNTGLKKDALVPQRRKQLENWEETPQRKMFKMDLLELGNSQCDASAKKEQTENGTGNKVSKSFTEAGTPNKSIIRPQVKKPVTVPKGPLFHSIHVPKNCTKRLQNLT